MFFNVKAVTQTQYATWLRIQQARVKANPGSVPKLPSGVNNGARAPTRPTTTMEVTSTVTDVTDVIAPPIPGSGLEEDLPGLHLPPESGGHGPDRPPCGTATRTTARRACSSG